MVGRKYRSAERTINVTFSPLSLRTRDRTNVSVRLYCQIRSNPLECFLSFFHFRWRREPSARLRTVVKFFAESLFCYKITHSSCRRPNLRPRHGDLRELLRPAACKQEMSSECIGASSPPYGEPFPGDNRRTTPISPPTQSPWRLEVPQEY